MQLCCPLLFWLTRFGLLLVCGDKNEECHHKAIQLHTQHTHTQKPQHGRIGCFWNRSSLSLFKIAITFFLSFSELGQQLDAAEKDLFFVVQELGWSTAAGLTCCTVSCLLITETGTCISVVRLPPVPVIGSRFFYLFLKKGQNEFGLLVYSTHLRISAVNALLGFVWWSAESFASGYLPKPDARGEGADGEGGQPGAAGPRWEHSAPRSLSARPDRDGERDDQTCFPKQVGPNPRDPELER